jgi:hypothetical protein
MEFEVIFRTWRNRLFLTCLAFIGRGEVIYGEEHLILPVAPHTDTQPAEESLDLVLVGNEPAAFPALTAPPERVSDTSDGRTADGRMAVLVKTQQVGWRVEEPVFVDDSTKLSWSWKKTEGQVCVVQLGLTNPQTSQTRYLGYGAGTWSEAASPDPTIEIQVAAEPPRQWTRVTRSLLKDIREILGWQSARINSFYLSPWDGQPGLFADMNLEHASRVSVVEAAWKKAARIGTGDYVPMKLRDYDDQHINAFQTAFEEAAPTRNSGANEWSAFGTIGDLDFNAMGRDLRVRYPLCDLVFRIQDGDREVKPDTLDSFRLGLVGNRLPAIWGGWRYGNLLYKVSVMTVRDANNGNYDLYKLEIQNSGESPATALLVAGVDGPPDMSLKDGAVRGLGEAALLIADELLKVELTTRDWGLCDKRAKAYSTGGGPGTTEEAVSTTRIGLDGVQVVYRVKAQPNVKYDVFLVASPHISGHLLETPKQPGDLVFDYRAEGSQPQTLDWVEYIGRKSQPLCVRLAGAHDTDGDGCLEVRAGVTAESRIRHTRLSVIYVFPAGTSVADPAAVYSGSMNGQCVHHIDVGVTPEQGWANQQYDQSDVGFARLNLCYGESIAPHTIRTFWLKVPPIHRRQPVSMGYIAHAFRDVLPGEAVPPFSDEKVASLRKADPLAGERSVAAFWDELFARSARFQLPDSVLNDMYLSRLATRAILNVQIEPGVVYNTCSPFFYFDHAYRDQAYVVFAFDLAGLHDKAAEILEGYCKNAGDIRTTGPISFNGKPLQLGMADDGLWVSRPGQWDTQGQNIWALVQHYKLSGDRAWLKDTAYPFIRRGAMWIVNSRHEHMKQIGDPADPRYGLLEPGAMEVLDVGKGAHMYYLNGFGVLGLHEAADAARGLGLDEEVALFTREAADLKACLHRSFEKTFKRTGLYEGHLWFGVEPEGVGMYGFWAHNCLLWPCRCVDSHDPLWTATLRKMEMASRTAGGGMHSEGAAGRYWPYIGVDRAIGYILRKEPEQALDYFCAYVDHAGGTLSWGEGYGNTIAGGDQPHFWADAQYVNLFRHLFAMEDGDTLLLTPALFRRWHAGGKSIAVRGLTTHFGDLDLNIQPGEAGDQIDYRIRIEPKGDQTGRELRRIVLSVRAPDGRPLVSVAVNGQQIENFSRDTVIIARPPRGEGIRVGVQIAP